MRECPNTAFQEKYIEKINRAYRNSELPQFIRNTLLAAVNIRKDTYLLDCPIVLRLERKLKINGRPTDLEKLVLAREVERIFYGPSKKSNPTSDFHPLVAFEE